MRFSLYVYFVALEETQVVKKKKKKKKKFDIFISNNLTTNSYWNKFKF